MFETTLKAIVMPTISTSAAPPAMPPPIRSLRVLGESCTGAAAGWPEVASAEAAPAAPPIGTVA